MDIARKKKNDKCKYIEMTDMSKNKENSKSVESKNFFTRKKDKENWEKKKMTANRMMKISAGPSTDGRMIKYDYSGTTKRGLFGEKNKSEKDKEKDALDRIAVHNKGVCWDYARCKKLLLSEMSPLASWICSFQRRPGITHTFLVLDGIAKLNDKTHKWEPINPDADSLKEAIASSTPKTITKCIIMLDPYYSQNVFLPDNKQINNLRDSPEMSEWFVMDAGDQANNIKNKTLRCCKWNNFASKKLVHPGKNFLYVIKDDYYKHFTEKNWKLFS